MHRNFLRTSLLYSREKKLISTGHFSQDNGCFLAFIPHHFYNKTVIFSWGILLDFTSLESIQNSVGHCNFSKESPREPLFPQASMRRHSLPASMISGAPDFISGVTIIIFFVRPIKTICCTHRNGRWQDCKRQKKKQKKKGQFLSSHLNLRFKMTPRRLKWTFFFKKLQKPVVHKHAP